MQHRIVSHDEWLAARKRHLENEKEFTRLRDRLSAERRELPWVKVEKPYVFDGPNGKETLAELTEEQSEQAQGGLAALCSGRVSSCPGSQFICCPTEIRC